MAPDGSRDSASAPEAAPETDLDAPIWQEIADIVSSRGNEYGVRGYGRDECRDLVPAVPHIRRPDAHRSRDPDRVLPLVYVKSVFYLPVDGHRRLSVSPRQRLWSRCSPDTLIRKGMADIAG